MISKADTNQMDTINCMFELVWSFVAIFLICEFGGMVTDRFEKFYDDLCQCNWYLYPMEIQRIYLIFMVNAQQPTMIQGFANIVCTREYYKKVHLFCVLELYEFEILCSCIIRFSLSLSCRQWKGLFLILWLCVNSIEIIKVYNF